MCLIKTKKTRKLNGMTLMELLVDLSLSAMVISSVFGLYVNYKRTYNYQSDLIFLYQNAKTAYDYLKDDVQVAGFYGCDSTSSSIEYAMTKNFDYDLSNLVSGYEATSTGLNSTFSLANPVAGWTPALQGQITAANANPGSDMITIRFADTIAKGILSADTTGLTLSASGIQTAVAVGDVMLISDCTRTVVFQVASVGTNTLTPTASVGNLNSGAELYKLNVHSYYVKTVNSIPGLYRMKNGVESLLVPYVENIQLMYGQNTNSDNIVDKFNTADSLTTSVVNNMSISILMRSIEKQNQSQTPTTFKMFNAPSVLQTTTTVTTPNDRYLRDAFDFNLNFPNIGGTI